MENKKLKKENGIRMALYCTALFLLLFISPLVYSNIGIRIFELPKWIFSAIALILLYFSIKNTDLKTISPNRTVKGFIVFFVAINFIRIHEIDSLYLLLQIIFMLLIFETGSAVSRIAEKNGFFLFAEKKFDHENIILLLLASSAAVMSLFALFSVILKKEIVAGCLGGFGGNLNLVSYFAVTGFICAVILYQNQRKLKKGGLIQIYAIFMILICTSSIMMLTGRGAKLSFFLICFIGLIEYFIDKNNPGSRFLAYKKVLFKIFVLLIIIFPPLLSGLCKIDINKSTDPFKAEKIAQARAKTFSRFYHTTPNNSIAARLIWWRNGLEMILDHPVLGIKPLGFKNNYYDYAAKYVAFPDDLKIQIESPHNFFIKLGSNFGLPVFFIFIYILLSFKFKKRIHQLFLINLAVCMGVSKFWLSIPMCLTFFIIGYYKVRKMESNKSNFIKLKHFIILFCFVFIVFAGIKFYGGTLLLKGCIAAQSSPGQEDFQATYNKFKKYPLFFKNVDLKLIHGNLDIKTGNHKSALESYKSILDLSSNNPKAYMNMSICYFALGQPEKGVEAAEKAMLYCAFDRQASYNLVISLLKKGDYKKTLDILDSISPLTNDFLFKKAECHAKLKNYDSAIKVYDQIISRCVLAKLKGRAAKIADVAYYKKILLKAAQGHLIEARKELKRAVECLGKTQKMDFLIKKLGGER